jgi:hypothetical protein
MSWVKCREFLLGVLRDLCGKEGFHRRDWAARSDNAYGRTLDSVFVGPRLAYACQFPNPYSHRMRPVCHPVRRGEGIERSGDRVIE